MRLATLIPLDDASTPAAGVSSANSNKLFAGLPAMVRSDVRRFCDRIELEPGQRLFGADDYRQFLYFPHAGAIGLISSLPSGEALQVALVDHRGVAGLPPLGNNPNIPCDAFVQLPGTATRMRVEAFDRLRRDATVAATLYTYLYSLTIEAIQSALCNTFHSVEQRCARWLLMLSDIGGNEFFITQDNLSTMLGVRRPSITLGALALQERGAISYRYGRMVIRDRAALEQSVCTCYRAIWNLWSGHL